MTECMCSLSVVCHEYECHRNAQGEGFSKVAASVRLKNVKQLDVEAARRDLMANVLNEFRLVGLR